MDRVRAPIHVLVNGSGDRTAEKARAFAAQGHDVKVFELERGDKCNAWNYYVHDVAPVADVHIFVDGDAEIAPDSLNQLADSFSRSEKINASAGVPLNGRNAERDRAQMLSEGGLYGDLYALAGHFVERIKQNDIRLPAGKIGDDSLIGALAATDLGPLSQWDRDRKYVCSEAGFYCEPINPFKISHLKQQFHRLVRYSLRHFEIKMMQRVLRESDATGLPREVRELHQKYFDVCKLSWRGYLTFFDWLAIRKIRKNIDSGFITK
jgi:glycosyltransferase involved in cell wall biosynthesis